METNYVPPALDPLPGVRRMAHGLQNSVSLPQVFAGVFHPEDIMSTILSPGAWPSVRKVGNT